MSSEIPPKVQAEDPQMEFDFETIHDAWCADGTLPSGNQEFKQDLVPIGEGKYGMQYANEAGDVYEQAVHRDDGGPDRYVLVEKKNVPEEVRAEIERLRTNAPDEAWTVLYEKATMNIANRKSGWPPKTEPLDPMLR